MGLEADCHRTVQEAASQLGGLDIIISNAVSPPSSISLHNPTNNHQGYTRFSNFNDLSSATVEDWDTCFAVNVKAQTHLMIAALPTFAANPEGGVFIITSSIAGRTIGGSSMPYSVTKAAQLHLMRCLAKTQGPKVRVNAVLPGWLDTEWGVRYTPEAIRDMFEKASLKKAVSSVYRLEV